MKERAEQQVFPWASPATVLAKTAGRGPVVFEAPEVSQIVRSPPRLPKVVRAKGGPRSLGLPFGVHAVDGRLECWSCARVLGEEDAVRAGPGCATCPGCGARLPFVD